MISIIEGLPDYAIGFEASGEVTKNDYNKVIFPAVQELVKRTGEIYYLFTINTGLNHFSSGAWWQDAKLGLKHYNKWKKIAIVTNSASIKNFTEWFGFLLPAKAKAFMMSNFADAKNWISEK